MLLGSPVHSHARTLTILLYPLMVNSVIVFYLVFHLRVWKLQAFERVSLFYPRQYSYQYLVEFGGVGAGCGQWQDRAGCCTRAVLVHARTRQGGSGSDISRLVPSLVMIRHLAKFVVSQEMSPSGKPSWLDVVQPSQTQTAAIFWFLRTCDYFDTAPGPVHRASRGWYLGGGNKDKVWRQTV